ncbi:MAG TPA: amidohydrolase family protein [Sphingomicrobium sp.]|nr:amidohydrolase family protein [Sphingomicrobium sp.]
MLRTIALTLALLSSATSADTLIYNVNGIQVGADGQIQRFRGLVIDDRGKVERLIQRTEELNRSIEHEVDGGGRTLLPGLIDAHGHIVDSPGGGTGLGLFLMQLDVVGTTSISDLQKRLARYASKHPEAEWIVGRGWNQELWPDKRFPTAADLDAVVKDRPVVLERVDGHALVANTAALRKAQVDGRTRDVDGGKIERDANGGPTGLLVDNAMTLVSVRIPAPNDALLDRAMDAAQKALLSIGITTATDMGTSPKGWAAIRRLAERGRLNVRIMAYADGFEPFGSVGGPTSTGWLYEDRLRLVGVKLYADGALGSRGAWLKQPYADKPDTRGLALMDDARLRSLSEQAAKGGLQVATHAIGDAANAQVISIYEDLARKYGRDRRWRIEHFQIADPKDISRLAPAGIIASMQPTHQTSDRLMAEARLGPDRLAGAYAWQTVLRSGARLAFGSDFPVESPNPFPGLAAAVSRQDMNGEPPGGWLPIERVSFAQALSGFTRDAAYAGFSEDRIGSLEPGKWADFILVDRDVSAVDPQDLARTQVLETWVAGKKVWDRPNVGLDAPGERGK